MEVKTKADLHQLIDGCPDYYTAEKIFLHILNTMLHNNSKEFVIDVANDTNKYISNYMLNSIHVCKIINENASYIESYLDGTMYQEDKPEYKEIQKNHAEYIKDLSEALLDDTVSTTIDKHRVKNDN